MFHLAETRGEDIKLLYSASFELTLRSPLFFAWRRWEQHQIKQKREPHLKEQGTVKWVNASKGFAAEGTLLKWPKAAQSRRARNEP